MTWDSNSVIVTGSTDGVVRVRQLLCCNSSTCAGTPNPIILYFQVSNFSLCRSSSHLTSNCRACSYSAVQKERLPGSGTAKLKDLIETACSQL